jgi:hypothetical protein
MIIAFLPSQGGGKTEHYGKVHSGNRFRKFCYESAAQKKYVDNKRKREQRSAAKRTEQEEACRIAPMGPLSTFFARRNYDETTTSPLPGAAEDYFGRFTSRCKRRVGRFTSRCKRRVGHRSS